MIVPQGSDSERPVATLTLPLKTQLQVRDYARRNQVQVLMYDPALDKWRNMLHQWDHFWKRLHFHPDGTVRTPQGEHLSVWRTVPARSSWRGDEDFNPYSFKVKPNARNDAERLHRVLLKIAENSERITEKREAADAELISRHEVGASWDRDTVIRAVTEMDPEKMSERDCWEIWPSTWHELRITEGRWEAPSSGPYVQLSLGSSRSKGGKEETLQEELALLASTDVLHECLRLHTASHKQWERRGKVWEYLLGLLVDALPDPSEVWSLGLVKVQIADANYYFYQKEYRSAWTCVDVECPQVALRSAALKPRETYEEAR